MTTHLDFRMILYLFRLLEMFSRQYMHTEKIRKLKRQRGDHEMGNDIDVISSNLS